MIHSAPLPSSLVVLLPSLFYVILKLFVLLFCCGGARGGEKCFCLCSPLCLILVYLNLPTVVCSSVCQSA